MTMTAAATKMGVIMGTAAYMSPEQAAGKPADRRSDNWSFGVVLWEMLTGQQLFTGESISHVLAAVLKTDPDWQQLPAGTPHSVQRLLRRCLERSPKKRLPDAAMARLEIDEAADSDAIGPAAAGAPIATRSPVRLGFSVAFIALAATLGGWLLGRGAGNTEQSGSGGVAGPIHFTVPLPGGQRLIGDFRLESSVVMAHGGEFLLLATDRIYVRDLEQPVLRPLPGTEGANRLFLSPDDSRVGFYAEGQIKVVGIDGGEPTSIAPGELDSPGAAWGADGSILLARTFSSGLTRIPPDGGSPELLTTPDAAAGERAHLPGDLLPGGRTALFTIVLAGTGINDTRVGLLDLTTREWRAPFPGARPHYLSSGHILYFHTGVWKVVAFDPVQQEVVGEPLNILPNARGLQEFGGPGSTVSVSSRGHLAYIAGPLWIERQPAWLHPDGRLEAFGGAAPLRHGALSPDERYLALTRIEGGGRQIWITDLDSGIEERLAVAGSSSLVVWHPDGDRFAFMAVRKWDFDIYSVRPDGRDERPLATGPLDDAPVDWTPDGAQLLVHRWEADGGTTLVAAAPSARSGDRTLEVASAERLASNLGGTVGGALSPDGRWLAYISDRSGRSEVYVQPFPGEGSAQRVSREGGEEPLWTAADTVAFRRGDVIVSVELTIADGQVRIGEERTVYRGSDFRLADVAQDGRLLLLNQAEPSEPETVHVILNWFEELQARVPTGR